MSGNGYWWDFFPGYANLTAKSNDLQVSYEGEASYYLGPFKGELKNLTLYTGVDGITGHDGNTYVYIVANKDDINNVNVHPYKVISNSSSEWTQTNIKWNLNDNTYPRDKDWYLYIKLTHDNPHGNTSHVALGSIEID